MQNLYLTFSLMVMANGPLELCVSNFGGGEKKKKKKKKKKKGNHTGTYKFYMKNLIIC
jgi:hypothetical protein